MSIHHTLQLTKLKSRWTGCHWAKFRRRRMFKNFALFLLVILYVSIFKFLINIHWTIGISFKNSPETKWKLWANKNKLSKKNRSEEEKILDCDEFCDGQVFQLPRFLNKGRTSRESTNLVVERTDDKYHNTDTVKLPISWESWLTIATGVRCKM